MQSVISRAKNDCQTPEEFLAQWRQINDFRKINMGKVYSLYNKKLREANALDFDDLLWHTVRLLETVPEVRDYYRRKFRYILIDEYQDTNALQYRLATLLTGPGKNICVVGDDDQSIYRFRGADITNILSFEKQFPGARVIRLEQNYRSTPKYSGRGQRRHPPQSEPQRARRCGPTTGQGSWSRSRPPSTRGTRPTSSWVRS